MAAYRFFNAILHKTGFNVEAWSNRPNMLRQYEPVAYAYLRTTEINNYNDSYNKHNLVRVQDFMSAVGNNPTLKSAGINRNIFNEVFGLYDLQNKGMSASVLSDELSSKGIVLDDDVVESVHNSIIQLP